MNIISTNMTNTVSTNVSPNSDGKKISCKIDFYILLTVLFLIISLFMIGISCYHYTNIGQN